MARALTLNLCLHLEAVLLFNKLFFNPPSRYSEDIDLVQIKSAKIGDIIDLLRSVLDSWMVEPKRNYSEGRISLLYKVTSDEGFPIKLKIEINTNENLSALALKITCLRAIHPGQRQMYQ